MLTGKQLDNALALYPDGRCNMPREIIPARPDADPEYMRRNLQVCKAVGAHANAKSALKRLQTQKRPPKWLVTYLQGIVERTETLPTDLAAYRDAIPVHLQPCVPGCYCAQGKSGEPK